MRGAAPVDESLSCRSRRARPRPRDICSGAMKLPVRPSLLVLLSLALPLSAVGCGGTEARPPKRATVQPGDMPEGGDWTGVYFSQLFGYLHLVKEGTNANGRWRTAAGDVWGELAGPVTGNLLKFEWKDHKIGMVGASGTRQGRGYFVYKIPKEGEAHEIHGEYGIGEDEVGSKWEAVKQKDRVPDLNSIGPDEYEGRGQGGGWDEEDSAPKKKDAEGAEGAP